MSLLFAVSTKGQEKEILTIVTTHEELNLDSIGLLAVPLQGPFMIGGNRLVSLVEGSQTEAFVFPDSMMVDDMIWTGKDFIVKSGRGLYMQDDLVVPLMEFDSSDFTIFPCDENQFFIVQPLSDSTSTIFMASLKFKRVKKLLTLKDSVIHIARLKGLTLITTSRSIYLFTENRCERYLKAWAPIRLATQTSMGLVFATDDEICLLTGKELFVVLFEGYCRQLLYDERFLYILTEKGDMVRCAIHSLDI